MRSTGYTSYRMSPNLSLSDVLIWIQDLRVFGENTTDMKFLSHYILSCGIWHSHYITGNVNFHHLVKVVFASFVQCEVTLFSLFILCCMEANHKVRTILENGVRKRAELSSTSWRAGHTYICDLKFFFNKDLRLQSSCHLWFACVSM